MTWFRRSARARPAVAPAAQGPDWWHEPVVRLTFADDSVLTLPPGDPRTRAFTALADALRGSSGSPVRPI
jgi:hypothetical protein